MRNDILNSRRMMYDSSRWEELDYIGMLKSMGCVFYLPLNADNETAITDIISGNKIELNQNYNNSYF
jgi:hypothetical protein